MRPGEFLLRQLRTSATERVARATPEPARAPWKKTRGHQNDLRFKANARRHLLGLPAVRGNSLLPAVSASPTNPSSMKACFSSQATPIYETLLPGLLTRRNKSSEVLAHKTCRTCRRSPLLRRISGTAAVLAHRTCRTCGHDQRFWCISGTT